MRLSYTAARRVVSGHTAGLSYDLDLYTQKLDITLESERTQQRANEGDEEVLLFYVDEVYSIQTDHMDLTTRDEFLEFFASCVGGEVFTFDPDRMPGGGSDISPRDARLVSAAPGLTRVDPNLNVWQASFQIRNNSPVS